MRKSKMERKGKLSFSLILLVLFFNIFLYIDSYIHFNIYLLKCKRLTGPRWHLTKLQTVLDGLVPSLSNNTMFTSFSGFFFLLLHFNLLLFCYLFYFIRLFFDAIERSLLSVNSSNLIHNLYRGEFVNQVRCLTEGCGCILLLCIIIFFKWL